MALSGITGKDGACNKEFQHFGEKDWKMDVSTQARDAW